MSNVISTLNSFEQALASPFTSTAIFEIDTVYDVDKNNYKLSATYNDILNALNNNKLPLLLNTIETDVPIINILSNINNATAAGFIVKFHSNLDTWVAESSTGILWRQEQSSEGDEVE